jgi:protein involved in polysaccharide export with SLBB domain
MSNLAFGQSSLSQEEYGMSGEQYITTPGGTVKIYVNIWGHVKNSGTYLIFDGADIMDVLSLAGGPLDGANLEQIMIKSKEDGSTIKISINDHDQVNKSLQPYDTIIIKQTMGNKILTKSSIISLLVQILNLSYTIDKLD